MSRRSQPLSSRRGDVPGAYYNEIDPYAADWLRNLIAAGHIAPGDVDERSIEDVHPDDLRSYTQCHFFAGIGVWSYALRRAGWPDDRPVWTGSCPCQPFSAAGKGTAFDDERHLWPAWHWLIQECRPPVVFGEQVASKNAEPWLDLVFTDLEALEYASVAIPFPSAGIGAPHIRDRLFWLANADQGGRGRRAFDGQCLGDGPATGRHQNAGDPAGCIAVRGLAHPEQHYRGCEASATDHRQPQADGSADWTGGCGRASGRMADAHLDRRKTRGLSIRSGPEGSSAAVEPGRIPSQRAGPVNGFWRAADWLLCRDGKWRPVEPGTFPLVDGAPARVGRLRAYGNAINAQQAQIFIESVLDIENGYDLV
ncbi:DNA cytosine methyltransferase [Achromobacter insolitus]|uniref:DNA cytosine methyltransferase n=1 Tax=Achromobacter insolitus TaxID=217204 RepID=UPI0020A56182|nr:DNA cytosine methyltransferase [Achromobacter insolitus]